MKNRAGVVIQKVGGKSRKKEARNKGIPIGNPTKKRKRVITKKG